MNLEKVRPHARHGSGVKSIIVLNAVEMKGRTESARGAAAELWNGSEGNGDQVRDNGTSSERRVATHTAPIRVGNLSSEDLLELGSVRRGVEIRREMNDLHDRDAVAAIK
jgi:hypothetical protein